MQIELKNKKLVKYVRQNVADGRYRSPEALVSKALSDLQDDPDANLPREELAALRREIAVGMDQLKRGEYAPWDGKATREKALKLLAKRRKRAG
jgi:hypothetical protein